jgi:hypothetical protein
MTDPIDIGSLLRGWDYDPDKNVRALRLGDGREIIQVRLPSGIEQYEMDGRPDGNRPYEMDSALDYFLSRLAEARRNDMEDRFQLSEKDCSELFEEGVLFYYRYLHLFELEDWPRMLRDTSRNMRLFDFIRDFAEREEDQQHLEQWRPYIVRMRAIAAAMVEINGRHHARAAAIVEDAIVAIEALPTIEHAGFNFERQRSLNALGEMATHIDETRPLEPVDRLAREMDAAIAAERFEEAAELRDRISLLGNEGA